jgi:DNA-binding protein H-NS
MSIDLKNLSLAQLIDLQKAIPAEMKARQRGERQKLLNEFREKAKAMGISLEELMGIGKTRARRGKAKTKVAAKYVHPANLGFSWSGRGKRPRWVNEWISSGKSLDQLRV